MRITVYRSGLLKREWRWRLRAANGRIIATSGEGYRNKQDCLDIVEKIQAEIPRAVIHIAAAH
jgi:uncharacterized protein YegP (UPF0339 family)